MKKIFAFVAVALGVLMFACTPEEQREAGYAEIAFDTTSTESPGAAFVAVQQTLRGNEIHSKVAIRLSKSERSKAGDPQANLNVEADDKNFSFKIKFNNPSANLSEKIADIYAQEALNADIRRVGEKIDETIIAIRKEISSMTTRNLGLMEDVISAKKSAGDDEAAIKRTRELENEFKAASDELAEKVSTLDDFMKKLRDSQSPGSFKQTKYAAEPKTAK